MAALRVGDIVGNYEWCPSCERRMHKVLFPVNSIICSDCIKEPIHEPSETEEHQET